MTQSSCNARGNRKILALNLKNLEYYEKKKPKFKTLAKAKKENQLSKRLNILIEGTDKAAIFYQKMFAFMFSYVAHRVPEITEEIYKIDAAMCAGFGWEMGPFEIWDSIGIKKGVELIKNAKLPIPKWCKNISQSSFYNIEDGIKTYYDTKKMWI